MAKKGLHPIQVDEHGKPLIDQGEHYGYKFTYNPDDDRFCVHELNEGRKFEEDAGGGGILATFDVKSRGWANAIQFARLKGKL